MVVVQQNTDTWLKMRRNYIGASDAPIIMGTCKWKMSDGRMKTPYVLWQDKLGLLTSDSNNASTRFGKDMEPVALAAYQDIVKDNFASSVVFHRGIEFMMASLDGINTSRDMAVEIKCASRIDHDTAISGKVPVHYYAQVQHQLEVTNLDMMHYFSFHKGEGVLVEVKRDHAYIEDMLKKEAAFWDCVMNFKEPSLVPEDYNEMDQEWIEYAAKLLGIKDSRKLLEKEEAVIEEKLKALSNGKNSRGGDFLYSCSSGVGRVDYKKIPELNGVDLNPYRGAPVNTWRLRIAK